uniref:Uncharacterized protein n=1 Tax=Timema poppense TaxID=170557 RepID=A0A7R9CXH8_TIMPO|nr:unnamed protein product [Timema poppensis]
MRKEEYQRKSTHLCVGVGYHLGGKNTLDRPIFSRNGRSTRWFLRLPTESSQNIKSAKSSLSVSHRRIYKGKTMLLLTSSGVRLIATILFTHLNGFKVRTERIRENLPAKIRFDVYLPLLDHRPADQLKIDALRSFLADGDMVRRSLGQRPLDPSYLVTKGMFFKYLLNELLEAGILKSKSPNLHDIIQTYVNSIRVDGPGATPMTFDRVVENTVDLNKALGSVDTDRMKRDGKYESFRKVKRALLSGELTELLKGFKLPEGSDTTSGVFMKSLLNHVMAGHTLPLGTEDDVRVILNYVRTDDTGAIPVLDDTVPDLILG